MVDREACRVVPRWIQAFPTPQTDQRDLEFRSLWPSTVRQHSRAGGAVDGRCVPVPDGSVLRETNPPIDWRPRHRPGSGAQMFEDLHQSRAPNLLGPDFSCRHCGLHLGNDRHTFFGHRHGPKAVSKGTGSSCNACALLRFLVLSGRIKTLIATPRQWLRFYHQRRQDWRCSAPDLKTVEGLFARS